MTTRRSDDAEAQRTPKGWTPEGWRDALERARRAILADAYAREAHPPAKVGYVEFNRRRGDILETIDRNAIQDIAPPPAGNGQVFDLPRPRPSLPDVDHRDDGGAVRAVNTHGRT
jgi:hypothetical protein